MATFPNFQQDPAAILGVFLPNVYLSSIELSTSGQLPPRPLDNPHIDEAASAEAFGALGAEQQLPESGMLADITEEDMLQDTINNKSLKISLKLMIKEKVDPDGKWSLLGDSSGPYIL